jgi:hypothetical protein
MSNREARRIDLLLGALFLLDLVLTLAAFLAPELWFRVFHGVAYVDPQGFLRRCGANWAAFALLQLIALRRWRRHPHWLAVIAGVRLSDMFTDWTYLLFAADITLFGRLSLFIVSPANLIIGLHFLRAFRRRTAS